MTGCRRFAQLISERLSGKCTPEESRLLQEHLDTCASCARLARELQRTRELLRSLPQERTSPAFDARLHARLLAERERCPDPQTAGPGWRELWASLLHPPRVWQPVAVAVLLLVIVAGGFVALRHYSAGPVSPPSPTVVQAPLPPLDELTTFIETSHDSYADGAPFAADAGVRFVVCGVSE